MMEYKGYQAAVPWDAAAGALQGEGVGLRDVIGFAAAAGELCREFQSSLADYLAVGAERGREPAEAYSGPVVPQR